MKAVIFVKESERLPGKHLFKICGEPMLARIYRTLKGTKFFDEVIVYSKYRNLELEGIKIERDLTEGVLIDSIISAIKSFGEFFAVGGDLPLMDVEVISKLLENYDGRPLAAVSFYGIVEPLFAIYNEGIYHNILEFSRKDRKIFTFIGREFRLIKMNEEESKKLFNVNTKEDFEEAREIARC